MNWYVTRDTVKSRLGLTDTTDDAILDQIIEDVSREIDRECRRHFFTWVGSRRFTCLDGLSLPVDDLIAVTVLKTDDRDNRAFSTTWDSADYELRPYNARQLAEPEPYDLVLAIKRMFPYVDEGVEITGSWGYHDKKLRRAMLQPNINSSVETFALDVSISVGATVLIGSEQMFVVARNGAEATVTRGVNGTTAAEHTTNDWVYEYQYPGITEAAIHQVILNYRLKDAPFGSVGGGGVTQTAPVNIGLHPFVARKLQKFAREVVR